MVWLECARASICDCLRGTALPPPLTMCPCTLCTSVYICISILLLLMKIWQAFPALWYCICILWLHYCGFGWLLGDKYIWNKSMLKPMTFGVLCAVFSLQEQCFTQSHNCFLKLGQLLPRIQLQTGIVYYTHLLYFVCLYPRKRIPPGLGKCLQVCIVQCCHGLLH